MPKTNKTPKVPEIRFTITQEFNEVVENVSKICGVDKSDYVRSLIINDLRQKGVKE